MHSLLENPVININWIQRKNFVSKHVPCIAWPWQDTLSFNWHRIHLLNNTYFIGWGFCDIQNSQSRGTGVSSWSQRLRLLTVTQTLIFLDVAKTKSCNFLLYIEEKNGSHVFASSLTASNTKCTNFVPLGNKSPWSYMTWLCATSSTLDMIVVEFAANNNIYIMQIPCEYDQMHVTNKYDTNQTS